MRKRRNPIVTGLLNALVPGSSHLYVNNDWSRFLPIFAGGAAMLVMAYVIGNAIQNLRDSTLPVGLCPAGLVIGILVGLFFSGMRIASLSNNASDDAAFYKSKRTLNPKEHKTENK